MTAPLLTITAYGLPAPQGSKRHVGRGVMVESSKHVKPWREAVKTAAIEARAPHYWVPLDEPLAVSMVFTMPKPVSAPKRRRTWPMRTPDLSKLIRSTEDALTDAGIWRDDARVVRYRDTYKAYPGEDEHALTSPGVVIRIWLLEQLAAADPNACPGPAHPRRPSGWCPICHGEEHETAAALAELVEPRPVVVPYDGTRHDDINNIPLPGMEVAS